MKIKTCPLCGGETKIIYCDEGWFDHFEIHCLGENCGLILTGNEEVMEATFPRDFDYTLHHNAKELIERWNKLCEKCEVANEHHQQ